VSCTAGAWTRSLHRSAPRTTAPSVACSGNAWAGSQLLSQEVTCTRAQATCMRVVHQASYLRCFLCPLLLQALVCLWLSFCLPFVTFSIHCTCISPWLPCRRQALDRGGVLERANKIATGHNADDIAETILLNIIRGDVPR
jgi:hypothetical protein